MGHPLILSLVGDYLHEPFWPTGTGIARGFLGVLDTAWLLRNVGLGKQPMSQILAEREYIYSLLSTTQPTNLSNSYHAVKFQLIIFIKIQISSTQLIRVKDTHNSDLYCQTLNI